MAQANVYSCQRTDVSILMHSFQVGQLHAHVGLIISAMSFAASKPECRKLREGRENIIHKDHFTVCYLLLYR